MSEQETEPELHHYEVEVNVYGYVVVEVDAGDESEAREIAADEARHIRPEIDTYEVDRVTLYE